MRYRLIYVLRNGQAISFSFSPGIDFEKYNKTILSMYGKRIIRRYVEDTQTGEVMSLRQLRTTLDAGKSG